MKFSLAFALIACLAFVAADPIFKTDDVRFADKEFLLRQKFLFDMVYKIHEPLAIKEYLTEADQFVLDKSMYTKFEYVEKFFDIWYKNMILRKQEIFSVFDKYHRDQATKLFNLFYYCKDWETFRHNVIWARLHLNEGLFTYALTMTVLHHPELKGLVLPAPYEICPYMFFNSKVIDNAKTFSLDNFKLEESLYEKKYVDLKEYNTKFNSKLWWTEDKKWWIEHNYINRDAFDKSFFDRVEYKEMMKDTKFYYTYANYTDDLRVYNDESKLAYFTEDLGWNSYYYYFHMDYPFWMHETELGLEKDRRGEIFLYMHQQLLARYYLERLSHHMGEIREFSWYKPIKTGYNPRMMYANGLGFSVRPNYWEIYSSEEYAILNQVEDYERRIRDIIDLGVYVKYDGTKINMRLPESIEILGNLIQGNVHHTDRKFLGYWMVLSHLLLSDHDFDLYKYEISNVMMHYETILRDPVFYMLYKRVTHYYKQYKDYLPSYTRDELLFKGVKINDATIEKLVTYFEYFDADITTVSNYDRNMEKDLKHEGDHILLARQKRINHKPFTFKLDIDSDKAQKSIIRVFLGPKFDEYGHKIHLNENRENFIEIDQFKWDLVAGKNYIKRLSDEFAWTVKDRTTYTELYKRVMMSIDGKWKFPLDMSEAHCGFPDRLIIPHGWESGMPMQFFFIVTPFDETVTKQFSTYPHAYSCGVGSGSKYIDNLPFGYPLDREIKYTEFYVPNMYFKDVSIYHLNDIYKH